MKNKKEVIGYLVVLVLFVALSIVSFYHPGEGWVPMYPHVTGEYTYYVSLFGIIASTFMATVSLEGK